MKRIYIILTYSGTMLSRLIKAYTKAEFSHVSIALDENLNQMYSFGRLKPYNPFIGGFVHEGINIGTFKRFKKTQTEIFSMMISDEQYKKMQERIKLIKNSSKTYKFNIIGLFGAGFNVKIHIKKSFYCAEFVKYLLVKAMIKNNLPDIVKPEDFERMENIRLEYKGLLREYKVTHKTFEPIDSVNSMIS